MNERMSTFEPGPAASYEADKAVAMLTARQILDEVYAPDEPEDILHLDQNTLVELARDLRVRIEDLAADPETGEVYNSNRLTIEYLAAYLRLAEIAETSGQEAQKVIQTMTRV